ncbi:Uncharacterised protein [Mycobacterium tuberculosis]|nr:Uncharacterised protein [Mycobacterium tuberculosis]
MVLLFNIEWLIKVNCLLRDMAKNQHWLRLLSKGFLNWVFLLDWEQMALG